MVYENKKPFEIVQEIDSKYETLSFEEFMKTYEYDEKISESYDFEVDSYKDISVGKLSGPMPFVDEATALIVARSDDIMTKLGERYSNVVEIFKHNPKGTIEWLKAEGALVGYNVEHNFAIDFTKEGNVEKSGPRAWQEYRKWIEIYVIDICEKWKKKNGEDFESRLRPAIKALSNHIHEEHRKELPDWPKIGKDSGEIKIELNIGGSYEADSYYIVWSCRGWMSIKDERPERYVYRAKFGGSPDMKILQLDGVLLGDLNRRVIRLSPNEREEALKSAKAMIDAKQGTRDPSLLTWEDFK